MKLNRLLWILIILALVVFGVLIGRRYMTANRAPVAVQVVTPEEPKVQREVILYFASSEGNFLVPETRDIDDCPEEETCLRQTVQALIQGPQTPSLPILPSQTVLRSIHVDGALATLDFSRDLISSHPGGSLSELMTVYGLVDTLAANFPYIRQVQILVEGEKRESIKGHVGIADPVTADFSYSREPSPEEPPVTDMTTTPGGRD